MNPSKSESPISLRIDSALNIKQEGERGPDTPSYTAAVRSSLDVVSHECASKTVLVVGGSGTGKSTFLGIMKDIWHQSDAKVCSVTQLANVWKILFNVNGKYCCVSFIDTPGFGDSSGKTNLEQENLIAKFVRESVTTLNLVLVAIPMGQRITEPQATGVLECLNFLGPELRRITGILATRSEGKSMEQKKQWFEEIKVAPHTSRMAEFCRGGLFFTGMSSHNDTQEQLCQFEVFQRKQIERIIRAVNSNKPFKLTGQDFQKHANKFMVFQSAAKDSLSLRRVLPELTKISRVAVQVRQGLEDIKSKVTEKDSKQYNAVMTKLQEINQEEVEREIANWCKLETAVEKYVGEGNKLTEAAESAVEIYSKLNAALREGRMLKFDIINLYEQGEYSVEEEAFGT